MIFGKIKQEKPQSITINHSPIESPNMAEYDTTPEIQQVKQAVTSQVQQPVEVQEPQQPESYVLVIEAAIVGEDKYRYVIETNQKYSLGYMEG